MAMRHRTLPIFGMIKLARLNQGRVKVQIVRHDSSAQDTDRHVQLRGNDLARLPDLELVRSVSGIHGSALRNTIASWSRCATWCG